MWAPQRFRVASCHWIQRGARPPTATKVRVGSTMRRPSASPQTGRRGSAPAKNKSRKPPAILAPRIAQPRGSRSHLLVHFDSSWGVSTWPLATTRRPIVRGQLSSRTPQGSGVRGRRASLASTRKHARPPIPCSRLLDRGYACASISPASSVTAPPASLEVVSDTTKWMLSRACRSQPYVILSSWLISPPANRSLQRPELVRFRSSHAIVIQEADLGDDLRMGV